MTPQEAKDTDEKLQFIEMSLAHSIEVFRRCLANEVYVALDSGGIIQAVSVLDHLSSALSRPTAQLTEILDSMDQA